MDTPLTKQDIIDDLRRARAEWDSLIAEVDEERATQPGAAGYWSLKDVIGHLTAVDRWYVNALQAHARGEPLPALEEQLMALDERNQLHYERNRRRPLPDLLHESQTVFLNLLELLQAESESYLTQPQTIEGLPAPIIVARSLKEACADHYRHHMPDVRAWLKT